MASASPRRLELLQSAGIKACVRPANVDESVLPGELPTAYVARLARAKAHVVADAMSDGLVLGADTVVVVDGDILGKPGSDDEAVAMLQRLSNRAHEVLTGVCLIAADRGTEQLRVESTRVWFAPLTLAELAAYVATGEPRDKAGAYAIQGRGALFIPRIEGSYSNVVGLPLAAVAEMLRSFQ